MARRSEIIEERRRPAAPSRRVSSLVWLISTWGLGAALVVLVGVQRLVPPELLMLDAASAPGGRWYYGLVTSLGVLGWTVSASACVVAAFVSGLAGRRAARIMFGGAALMITTLLLDDLFLLHSNVAPELGVPSEVFQATEGLIGLVWIVSTRTQIRRTRWELLAMAAAMMFVSQVIDFGPQPLFAGWYTVAEEGTKFLAILGLATWSILTAADVIRSVVTSTTARESIDERSPAVLEQTADVEA